MNVGGMICLILGLACLIVAATVLREARYKKGGHTKPTKVGECTLHLHVDASQAITEMEKIRRLLDPNNEYGSAGMFGEVAPYLGEFKPHCTAAHTIKDEYYVDAGCKLHAIPRIGSAWRHKNGGRYIVIAITNVSNDRKVRPGHLPGVYYQTLAMPNTHWHRDLTDWHRSFTYLP